jgi:2-hydroxychromene-2-carboxylate isomerase
VKEAHPQLFVQVFFDIFRGMWEDGLDVSKPELLGQVLSTRLSKDEVRVILEKANSAPYKQRLNDNTKEALDKGAFGCPWYSVRNAKGEEEPFFGSDRYVPLRFKDYLLASGRSGMVPVTDGKGFSKSMRTLKHGERTGIVCGPS